MGIDAYVLWQMDKSQPLKIVEASRETTCVLCDGPISRYDWIVTIPKAGKAHPHCAGDEGWTVK